MLTEILESYLEVMLLLMKLGVVLFGIIVDDYLQFDKHINKICSQLSKSIGIMFKLQSYVPKKVMSSLYYSLVYPYLVYCNVVWGGIYITIIDKLFLR